MKIGETKNLPFFFSYFSVVMGSILFFISTTSNKSWAFHWENVRSEVRDSVRLFEKGMDIHIGAVGYAGRKTKQHYLRLWLLKNASQYEMEKLINYPSPCVKAIAYESLLRRKNTLDKKELFVKALNDTTSAFSFFSGGCVGDAVLISEYLIAVQFQLFDDSSYLKSYFLERMKNMGLKEEEVEDILSIYYERKAKREEYLGRYFWEL